MAPVGIDMISVISNNVILSTQGDFVQGMYTGYSCHCRAFFLPPSIFLFYDVHSCLVILDRFRFFLSGVSKVKRGGCKMWRSMFGMLCTRNTYLLHIDLMGWQKRCIGSFFVVPLHILLLTFLIEFSQINRNRGFCSCNEQSYEMVLTFVS